MDDFKGEVSSSEASARISNTKRDLDQAYYYLEQAGTNVTPDIDLKVLRRRIDWKIVPIMFCAYTMQFIDKVLLNVSEPEAPCNSSSAVLRKVGVMSVKQLTLPCSTLL